MTKRPISKAFIILSLFAILLLGFSTSGFSTIYYVNTASTGTGDGTTQEITGEQAAWKAISEITGLVAGDSVLFNKGNTWREQLTVPTSGSDGSPITYGAYGEGADPIINGSTIETEWAATELGGWQTAVTWNDDGNYGAGSAWNRRIIILANVSSYSGTKIRITIKGEDAHEGVLAGSSIGLMTTDDDMDNPADGTFKRITWTDEGGGNGVTLPADTLLVSDELDFNFDKTERYGVHFYWTTAYSAVDWAEGEYYKTSEVDDTLTQAVNYGYSPAVEAISKLEVYVSSGDPIYQKTFSEIPRVVLEDGVLLTYVLWDTDIATTAASMSAGTFTIDSSNKIAYVWCTDGADPDTHTMEVAAGSTDNDKYGILIRNKSYVTIDGIKVQNTTQFGILVDSTEGNDVSNVTVQNCVVYATGHEGIVTLNWANHGGDHPITNITFDNCTVSYVAQHGLAFSSHITDSIMSNCTSHHNAWKLSAGWHGISMVGYDATARPTDCVVEHCEAYNIYDVSGGDEGTGIQIDDECVDCTVRYCIAHDNAGSGFINNNNTGSSFYYNISYDNGRKGFYTIEHQAGTLIVYNNIFYSNDAQGIYISPSNTATKIVKNNILAENTGTELEIVEGGHVNLTCDYNCVYHSGGGTFMDWRGTDYNWADWLTNSSQDANSINSDPLMIDPANGNFKLNPHSPCVNAGTDVSLTEDYEGLKIRHAPDIGAHENQANALFFSWNLLKKILEVKAKE